MKVVTVVGARPQFIKAAPVSRALREQGIVEVLVHTGQHYDANMSDVFFGELSIPEPHYNLGIGSAAHGAQTGRMLEALESVLLGERPDWVVVYGDTNSTLAGALAATKLGMPVAHVEAGLRSFNRAMPEEINRVLTDHASDLLLTPTDVASSNLIREGVAPERIHQVGDVMFDAALQFGECARAKGQVLQRLGLERRGYVLATVHRAESTNNRARLRAIFEGLVEIGTDETVVMPVHPRTRAALDACGLLASVGDRLRLIDPLGYLDMLQLESNAQLIVTDSGGVQKEAFFVGVPCVTLRAETEWTELVGMGWNRLVPPTDARSVADGIRAGLAAPPGADERPYGDGRSAARIARLLAARPH